MIALGSNEISKVCLGSNELSKVCLGATEIYSSGTPLPYDAEIEYLEGTGTQWLDTGIPVVNGILMEYYGAFGANSAFVGAMGDSSGEYLFIRIYNAYNIAIWRNGAKYVRVNPKQNTFYNIYHDSRGLSNIVKWNGSEVLNEDKTAYSNPDTNVRVFNDVSSITKGKIRILKLTDNSGNVVLDWKAVRVGQVGYMYDSITGTLHGNDGTDSFVLGNDL